MLADFIFSLGPNCRNAWNLKNHFRLQEAYPFDWWITPALSMLRMITPDFRFQLTMNDLHIIPLPKLNSVFNSNLNILHHHDFIRNSLQNVESIDEKQLAKVTSKYQFLFSRFFDNVANATMPIAVLNGTFAGWPNGFPGIPTNPSLNCKISHDALAREIRDRIGKKLKIIFISGGESLCEEHDWGINIAHPDSGAREHIDREHFTEPVHIFRQAYERLGIVIAPNRLR